MKLSQDLIKLVKKNNNLGTLRLLVREYLKIRYQWINKINDIKLLQEIITKELIEIINFTIISQVTNKSEIPGLNNDIIEKLFLAEVYTKDLKIHLLTIISITKKHSPSKKRVMWKPRKKKEIKKAVSRWLTAFAVIILVTQLLFFLPQNYLLLLFLF